MELTMYGFEVYSTEVDDRGIDFIARKHGEPFIEIQVKSLRKYGYIFMQKTKFEIRKNVYHLHHQSKSFLNNHLLEYGQCLHYQSVCSSRGIAYG